MERMHRDSLLGAMGFDRLDRRDSGRVSYHHDGRFGQHLHYRSASKLTTYFCLQDRAVIPHYGNTMRHITLEEWDKLVSPKLGAIKGRSVWIRVDANQILDWVNSIPVVPDFETEAIGELKIALASLVNAKVAIEEAIRRYEIKEKTD